MNDNGVVWQEVRPGSAWDPDASRAAAELSAYFQLEWARASRRRLVRVTLVAIVLAMIVEAATRLIAAGPFLAAVMSLCLLPLTAAVLEWRADRALSALTTLR